MTKEKTTTTRDERVLMTVADLARYLQVSEKFVRRGVSAGEIPHLRFGTNLRFRPDDIEKWIDSQHG